MTRNSRSFSAPAGLKSIMVSQLPLILNSFMLLRPSGVTSMISILEFLAMIKFRSVGLVKFPYNRVIQNTDVDINEDR